MTKIIRLITAAALAFWNTPAYAAVRQEVDVKVQHRTQKTHNGGKSAVPEEYGEIPNGLILERYLLDFENEKYGLEFEAENLNRDNQSLKLRGGQPGKLSYSASWDEMPHLFSNEARSLYKYDGNGIMVLPKTLQSFHETNSATFNTDIKTSLQGAQYQRLGFDVKTGRVDLKFHPAHDFAVDVGAWRQTRTGTKPQPAPFGFSNAIELAAPIDWTTHEAYLDMHLTKKDYQAGFSYRLSDYNNKIPSLTWDNPKRLTNRYSTNGYSAGDQSAKGQLANAPDNQAHSVKVEGGVNLPLNSRVSAEAGYQRWTAFNPMLPYTTNTAIKNGATPTSGDVPTFDASDPRNLPDSNVDTKIEVYTYMGKLSSRPLSWLRGSLTHEAYILDNKSKRYTVPGWGIFDQGWHAETKVVAQEEFRDDKTALKFDYEVTDWLSGDLGAKHTYRKVTREIPKLREDEGTAGFTIRPKPGVWANLSYLAAFRRGNGMDYEHYPKTSDTGGRVWFTEAPGLRRPDVADRNRNQARLQLNWTEGEAMVSLSARMTDDRYRSGKGDMTGGDPLVYPELFGTVSDRQEAVGVDFSLPLPANLTADAYYEYDRSKRILRSNQTQPANTCGGTGTTYIMCGDPRYRWETRLTENAHISGVQLTWTGIEKLKTVFGYDLTYTRFNGDPVSNGSLVTNYKPFETSRRMMQTLRARGEYEVLKDLTLAANYAYEKFDATDFAYGNVPLRDTSNASIFLGANPIRNYYAHTVGAGMKYRF